jgi:hypothetical protein
LKNHARMTITIPLELKARMDAYKPSANWSAVASRAFAAVVGVADKVDGPDHDMTVISPEGSGTGVRLLDDEDRDTLLRDIYAGRIVAIFNDASGANLAYVVCTNAEAMHGVFVNCDDSYAYEIKD